MSAQRKTRSSSISQPQDDTTPKIDIDEVTHNQRNKRHRNSETSETDTNMQESSQSPIANASNAPDNNINIPPSTTTAPQDKGKNTITKGIDSSVHNPNMITDTNPTSDRTIQIRSSPNQMEDKIITNTATVTPSNNNKNPSQLNLENFQGQQEFYSFIPITYFKPPHDINNIKSYINQAFITQQSFGGIAEVQYISNIPVFVLRFYNKSDRDAWNDTKHGTLKVTIHDYTQENLNEVFKTIVTNKKSRTIKVVDVPSTYNVDIIISKLSQFGNISNHNEKTKTTRPHPQSNNPPQSRPARFKHVIVEFTNISSVNKIIKNDIWSLELENFTARILPSDINSPEYAKRTAKCYKITGLPVNANARDLSPILHKINGKTCTIPFHNQRQITKSAFVYLHEKDFSDKISTISCFDKTIYISPVDIQTCTVCGNPKHNFQQCDLIPKEESNPQIKRFTINRTNRQRLFLDSTLAKELTTNVVSKRPPRPDSVHSNVQPSWDTSNHFNNKKQFINYANAAKQQAQSDDYQLQELKEEINILKQQFNSISKEFNQIKENNTLLKQQVQELQQENKLFNEKLDSISNSVSENNQLNNHIKKQNDQILNKLSTFCSSGNPYTVQEDNNNSQHSSETICFSPSSYYNLNEDNPNIVLQPYNEQEMRKIYEEQKDLEDTFRNPLIEDDDELISTQGGSTFTNTIKSYIGLGTNQTPNRS